MNTNTMRLDAEFRAHASGVRRGDTAGWLTWAKSGLASLRGMRQRRRAIAELSRMSDWRLADMGIPRDRIAEVVDGLIAREGPDFGGTGQ